MNILAFAASSSRQSINKQLVTWVTGQFSEATVTLLDLNDFEMPIFSADRLEQNGVPELAHDFVRHIDQADGILISFAEHNGSYSAAFKNIFDWASVIPNRTVFADKPMLLLATSPGRRGASSVLDTAAARFPYNGGEVIGTFSLPTFGENFSPEAGITNPELREQLLLKVEALERSLSPELAAD